MLQIYNQLPIEVVGWWMVGCSLAVWLPGRSVHTHLQPALDEEQWVGDQGAAHLGQCGEQEDVTGGQAAGARAAHAWTRMAQSYEACTI